MGICCSSCAFDLHFAFYIHFENCGTYSSSKLPDICSKPYKLVSRSLLNYLMNSVIHFLYSVNNCRKIVLATNIAESSITIDDVVYVIDCGKAKETSYDALNKLACLLPSWISKASAHQVNQFFEPRSYIDHYKDSYLIVHVGAIYTEAGACRACSTWCLL